MIFGSALFGKLAIISSGEDTEEYEVIVEVIQLQCHWQGNIKSLLNTVS